MTLAFLLAFPMFNIAMGMLNIVQPWLAHDRLAGGARTLGLLVGVLAAAELVGSLTAGARRSPARPLLWIGGAQMICGAGLLLFLGASLSMILLGEIVCALPAGFAAVCSQTVRYERIPEHLRARTLTLISTLILGAVPLGSLVGGPLLAAGHYDLVVMLMAAFVGPPGLLFVCLAGTTVGTEWPAPGREAERAHPLPAYATNKGEVR
jgi:predicted MFS family arabinose efflux permease